MRLNGKVWDKWMARAEASPVLTKAQFWACLSEEERAFFDDLNQKMGPLKFVRAWRNEEDE